MILSLSRLEPYEVGFREVSGDTSPFFRRDEMVFVVAKTISTKNADLCENTNVRTGVV